MTWSPDDVALLRQRLKVDAASLARIVGVDTRSVSRWESGEATPTASAEAVMSALREAMDRWPHGAGRVASLVRDAASVGGLAYLLVRLLEPVAQAGPEGPVRRRK